MTLTCDPASRLTFVVRDGAGQPVANARVFPSGRQSRAGDKHLVYFQASDPIQTASDAKGCVGLGCFERGDQAEIYVQLPGQDWQRHTITIPNDGDVVELIAAEVVRPPGSPSKS